jgi:hypothetical protein
MIIEIEYTFVFLVSDCGLLDRETTDTIADIVWPE